MKVGGQFFIKDSTFAMMKTGLLRQDGGVIRWAAGPNKGQIFEILKASDIIPKNAVEKVSQMVAANPKAAVLIIAGGTLLLTTGGIFIYKGIKSKRRKEVFEIIYSQSEKIGNYMSSLEFREINIGTVQEAREEFQNMLCSLDDKHKKVELTKEEYLDITSTIMGFSKYLAEKNKDEGCLVDGSSKITIDKTIRDCIEQLKYQERWLRAV